MDESRLKEGTAIRRIREETLALLQGPRVQVTFLYGAFQAKDEDQAEDLYKRQMGRLRLVVTETGGKFEELGKGRFCATHGAHEPTEEDPLMAVTLALKLLRMVGMSKQVSLRVVVVTGRLPHKTLEQTVSEVIDLPPEERTHDLLNLAEKVMQDCPEGSLYVDGMTARMVRDTHRCNRIKDLKGALSTSNVPVYAVSNSASSTNASFEPPLCGRTKELQHMLKVFQRLELGEGPTFFTVTGDLGIGKTKLLRTFSQKVEDRATIFKNPRERRRIDRWRRTPYSYFGEIIRFFFEIYDNEEDAISRNKLVKGLHQTLPPSDKNELPLEMAHYLGLLCQIDFPESPFLREMSPAQQEQNAFTSICNYLEQASQHKPIVFVLDDLYSADNSSLRLLRHLTMHLEPSRVLFLCSSRQQLLQELEKEGQLALPGERLVLKPMTRDASRMLIMETIGNEIDFPEALCRRILDIAEGNPFFIREILRDLEEQGLSEALKKGTSDAFDIPGNIEAILLSRISRLTPQQREVLQKASVFGKSFWKGGVEMLFRQDADMAPGWRLKEGDFLNREDDLEEVLEHLADQGVIQYRSESDFEGEIQYHFSPSWLQELVYKEVPEELLAPYHRLVGMWLEMQAERHKGTDLDAEIAHHFDLGGEPTRAAPYHIEVGVRAKNMYATERALEHLEKGLNHLEQSQVPKRMQAIRQLAEVYILDGAYTKAQALFRELLELSWQMGNRVLAGEIYIRMGRVSYLMRDFQEALAQMRNGHTLHQEGGYKRGIATALSNMGEVYLMVGEYKQARLYLQEALDLRRELHHKGDLSYTLSNMGNLLIEQGELESARQYHQEALDLRKSIGNPHLIIRSMNNLALIHMVQGNYDAALAELLMTSNMAQKLGEKLMMAVIMSNIAELCLLRGEVVQAQTYIDRSIQLGERLGDKFIQAECLRIQGELALEQEDPEQALSCCRKAHKLVTEAGILSSQSQIFRLLAEVYAVLPEAKEDAEETLPPHLVGNAIACYEESVKIAHQHGNRREEARTRMLMGMYEVNRGNVPRGRYQLQLAQNTFMKLHMVSEYNEVKEMLEQVDSFQKEGTDAPATPAVVPAPNPAALRPLRAKMANVEKTMTFRVSFDESEMGPPPTPAQLSLQDTDNAIPNQALQAPPTDPGLPPKPQLPPANTAPPAAPQQTKGADKTPSSHTLSAMPGVSALQASSGPKSHTLASQQAVSSGDLASALPFPAPLAPLGNPNDATVKRQAPIKDLLSQGVLKHAKGAEETKSVSLPEPATLPKGNKLPPPPPIKRTSSKNPKLVAKLSDTKPGRTKEELPKIPTSRPPRVSTNAELLAAAGAIVSGEEEDPNVHGTRDLKPVSKPPTMVKKSQGEKEEEDIPLSKQVTIDLKEEDTPPPAASASPEEDELLEDSDLLVETLDVVDPKLYGERGEQKPKAPAKGGGQPTQQLKPPPIPKQAGNQPAAPKAPAQKTESPADALPALNIPSRLTTPTDLEEMPFLFPTKKPKTPSVYDSQVIIAQVADGDDLSKSWFEEGRSDRTDEFWEKHKDERDAVKEELLHEQVIEEIDNLEKKPPNQKKKDGPSS